MAGSSVCVKVDRFDNAGRETASLSGISAFSRMSNSRENFALGYPIVGNQKEERRWSNPRIMQAAGQDAGSAARSGLEPNLAGAGAGNA